MIVTFCGIEVVLNPMDTAPKDGTAILVLLEKKSLGRVWHTAQLHKNVSFVGHYFAFDCPKMLGWIQMPELKE